LDYPACFIADFLTGRSAVRTHKLGLILGVVLLAASAWAGDGGSPAEAVVTHRGLHIPRLKQTPTLADFLSMQPSERMQGKMVRVNSFIQRDPSEGRPATQKTDVYLGYDQRKLYAVFICFDGSPDLVDDYRCAGLAIEYHTRGVAFSPAPIWAGQWLFVDGQGQFRVGSCTFNRGVHPNVLSPSVVVEQSFPKDPTGEQRAYLTWRYGDTQDDLTAAAAWEPMELHQRLDAVLAWRE